MNRWRSLTVWMDSLFRAAIGGGCNVIAAMVVAPVDFNFDHPAKLWKMAGAGALIAIVHYLQKQPLPSWQEEEQDAERKAEKADKQ